MTVRRCELHVDELVLEGMRPADARRVGAALERELARLVRERGAPDPRVAATAGAAPVEMPLRRGEAPGPLGARLAGAIYGRLTP
jgi:hypothetical protein